MPLPPLSKRRTEARMKVLKNLATWLQLDTSLAWSTEELLTLTERDVCNKVQNILDLYVQATFQPWDVREITWGGTAKGPSMPCVEIGGHRYYPDHIIWRGDLTVAVEVKRYRSDSDTLLQIIGQSIIYAQAYSFVLGFIADATPDGHLAKRVNNLSQDTAEKILCRGLWEHHNIMIVCRHVREKPC